MGGEARLPMFPLQTVLVPAAPVALHIFEPRYRTMMEHIGGAGGEFGVVLIERGSEVGGGEVRSRIGTVARIVRAERSEDGRWGIVAVGTRRIDVAEWLPDDPYPVASAVDRPDRPWTEAAAAALGPVESGVRRALARLAELGDEAAPATVELDPDPLTRSWQLLAVAPLTALDRHALLAIDDPEERIRRMGALVDEELSVLALRMKGL